jgi:hypothetical protein
MYLYDFHIFKLNDLKVIHDLYSQCLTQTLSKTTSNREPEGVLWSKQLPIQNCLISFAYPMMNP